MSDAFLILMFVSLIAVNTVSFSNFNYCDDISCYVGFILNVFKTYGPILPSLTLMFTIKKLFPINSCLY